MELKLRRSIETRWFVFLRRTLFFPELPTRLSANVTWPRRSNWRQSDIGLVLRTHLPLSLTSSVYNNHRCHTEPKCIEFTALCRPHSRQPTHTYCPSVIQFTPKPRADFGSSCNMTTWLCQISAIKSRYVTSFYAVHAGMRARMSEHVLSRNCHALFYTRNTHGFIAFNCGKQCIIFPIRKYV